MTTPTGPVPAGSTVPSPDRVGASSSRETRERLLKRSKAVAAAASIGGFASLVAVLIGHPASATTKTSTAAKTSSSTSARSGSTSDDATGATSSSGSSSDISHNWSGGSAATVQPDTVTTAS